MRRDGEHMHEHTCRCGLRFPVSSDTAVSLHRSSDGLVGYVRCPLGHLSVASFATRRAPRTSDARRVA